ncbi:TetR/AcrR family transcriptional regulator [Marivibrio halodurans]|uniref:TetR/AcrR family transcriptional regulator n=1 Tax=Marivibrio halodurans TaxID=2039722 RepID=A0A8J7SGX0_9PROT|nr:TetR/AcrR family transcriptional regulator [Marivibrio halodurans]MBP5855998.1 TetR/AcrR family transcriptional regulator [Marivibrio halodurans]
MIRCGSGDGCRRRGRPKELSRAERERRLLDAAERLLVREGIERASMAAIAREAGMSKRTLYDVFADRAALFEACVRRLRSSFVRPLIDSERRMPLAERLERIFDPDGRAADQTVPLGVLRAVILEAHRHPDLGQVFLREGPDMVRDTVRAELDRAAVAGEIAPVDTELAARMFCDMVFENPIDRLVDPDRATLSKNDVRQRLSCAIDIFLKGVARA